MTTSATGIELTTRRADKYLYVVAVRSTPAPASKIHFTGLPARNNGSPLTGGEVLIEYVQGAFRTVNVSSDSFTDWFGPHDARAYRFALS